MSYVILNILSLCLALAATETLHGIFRATVLVPRIGKRRALRVSIITGSILAFFVCYLLIPNMGISNYLYLLLVGIVIALFMASFDILLAKIVLKRPISKSIQGLNPKTGNYLIYGLLLLTTLPITVTFIQTELF